MTNNANIVPERAGWRGRGSLSSMVSELKRQIDARLDFVIDSRDLVVAVDGGQLRLKGSPSAAEWIPRAGFALQRQALRQLAERANPSIPLRHVEEAAEKAPRRLADYMTGLMHDAPERRLVRVLDGKVRGFLSDAYKCIDNADVAAAVLEGAKEARASILEATLSDTAMRIKLVVPEIVEDVERVRSGDASGGAGSIGSPEYLARVAANSRGTMPQLPSGPNAVCPILTVGNSETGHGTFFGRVGILQAFCVNLATVETKLAQVHLGQRLETGIFSRETIALEADLILRKGKDLMRTAFDPARFKELVDKVRATVGQVVVRPIAAVEVACRAGLLGLDRLDALTQAFMQEPGGTSVYNLGQAIARVAQDVDNADEASEWEQFAGDVLSGKHSRELMAAGAA